jgi:hypothetical protein
LPNRKESKGQRAKESVLEATDRKTVGLIVVKTADRGITRVQGTNPGIATTLRRRPKGGGAGAIVVIAISETVTGRRGVKAGGVEVGMAGKGVGIPVLVGRVVAG